MMTFGGLVSVLRGLGKKEAGEGEAGKGVSEAMPRHLQGVAAWGAIRRLSHAVAPSSVCFTQRKDSQ